MQHAIAERRIDIVRHIIGQGYGTDCENPYIWSRNNSDMFEFGAWLRNTGRPNLAQCVISATSRTIKTMGFGNYKISWNKEQIQFERVFND